LPDSLFELFDDYAIRFARGENPDPVPYLDRAGSESSVLAEMIDRFLQWAPPPTADETAVRMMQAWLSGEPPLRELRVERGVRVDEIVGRLAATFNVDVAQVGKVRRYVQRLERGALDTGHVDWRVFEELAAILRTSASTIRNWARPPRSQLSAAPAYRSDPEPPVAPAVARATDDEWDAVDELFMGSKPRRKSSGPC
jgi:AcrR family transcriptional regulator